VATSVDWDEEPYYGGFLGNLMPSSKLLPCAIRRSNSHPLTPRSVAQDSGRPEAPAYRVLIKGGFAGVERTFGNECTRAIGDGEVPLARIRLLKFHSVQAAREWAALPWAADAGAVSVLDEAARKSAWLKRSCGDAPAAVFWQEDRAGNVIVAITIYTSPESLESQSVVNYARLLADDTVREFMPQTAKRPSAAAGSGFD
jgi:hypothetical protein